MSRNWPDRSPRISVCVPTYNNGRYLREALDSILGQSLQEFEIIVSDDASTDDTPAIVAQVRDERLRYVRQARNVGIAENRNRCLAIRESSSRSCRAGDPVSRSWPLARTNHVSSSNRAAISGICRLVTSYTLQTAICSP